MNKVPQVAISGTDDPNRAPSKIASVQNAGDVSSQFVGLPPKEVADLVDQSAKQGVFVMPLPFNPNGVSFELWDDPFVIGVNHMQNDFYVVKLVTGTIRVVGFTKYVEDLQPTQTGNKMMGSEVPQDYPRQGLCPGTFSNYIVMVPAQALANYDPRSYPEGFLGKVVFLVSGTPTIPTIKGQRLTGSVVFYHASFDPLGRSSATTQLLRQNGKIVYVSPN